MLQVHTCVGVQGEREALSTPEPGVVVTSFGYLHGDPPVGAAVTVDVRVYLRDPHISPELRELTGRDEAVRVKVLGTPGAVGVIDGVSRVAWALCGAAGGGGGPVGVAVGCAGGRHRSVVIVDAVVDRLRGAGVLAVAEHRHLHHRVVDRSAARGPS